MAARGQAKRPDFMHLKAEWAGVVGRLDKGVRERDAHIQMRKPE